ncbi:amidohydrolase family protein [Geitlerinema sp. PCC 7407]|uniref:amidohydrolase family protein n=1 Tax=Geitlerinema sp. PCC 7407 TaxID=1173025 RepID=UPI00029FE573|nr:amidohydrolase [Geitlerinema sp. PCC 7407]AFY66261.1 amidohydrolase [Geitlerinema sp. PCC 7407]
MASILISGGTILTSDDEGRVIDQGYIILRDRHIVEVAEGSPHPATVQAVDQVVDAQGMLVCPGFINAHTHLCMILGRSLGSDRALLHWLSDSQIPLMQAFKPEDYAISMELGALENLKAGNTTICEVFFSPHYDQGVDEIAVNSLDRTGIRTVFFRCSNDETFLQGFDGFIETREEIVQRSEHLICRCQNHRTQIGLGPLIPWGSTPGAFMDAVQLSQEKQVHLHLHTAETPEYNDLVRQRTGKSNVEMLADVGALGDRVMLNHCVHLSEQDMDLIAQTGTHVIHDPTSNMILASGVAPVPELRQKGVNVGLACDGPACNNTQDMIQVMKDAALLHKVVTRQPEVLVAQDVFRMATRGGAKSIGMADSLGSLHPGFLADIILIDTQVPHMTPLHDPVATLVYSARGSDVTTVIVDGRIVMRDRQVLTVDEEAVLAKARERAMKARRRANL